MNTADDRSHLARQQSQILSALRTGTTPEGFSSAQLAGAAESLFFKRRREAALAAPMLAAVLGSSFNNHFAAYATGAAYPERGPPADAAAFGRHLMRQNQFPATALPEWLRLATRSGPFIQLHAVMKSLTLTVRIRNRAWIVHLIRPPNRGR